MTARPIIFLALRSSNAAFASLSVYRLEMIGLRIPFLARASNSTISA